MKDSDTLLFVSESISQISSSIDNAIYCISDLDNDEPTLSMAICQVAAGLNRIAAAIESLTKPGDTK